MRKTTHFPDRKITRMLMEVAGKDILSGHVSLSASMSQSQEALRKKGIWKPWQHTILAGEK